MSENKDMTGSLFKSQSQNPRAPVLSGYVVVNGEELRVAAWYAIYEDGRKRKDKHGNPWLNLKITREDGKQRQRQPDYPADDDLPI